jgi:hypothetical protein
MYPYLTILNFAPFIPFHYSPLSFYLLPRIMNLTFSEKKLLAT